MNSTRNLKQQEKYDNMLKRKNKEKNIYKSKNSTLRIEKMNLIKAVERKNKEIERLHNIINEAINYIDDNTYYKSHKGNINIDDVYIILQEGSDKNE